MMDTVTIVMVARNAAATIERAVRSALRSSSRIVLVDDFSSDGTAAIATAVAGNRVRVVSPERHGTSGLARQTGIDAVTTRYAVWLDVDDELLPGRAERLLACAEREGADLVFDSADLHDGVTGAFISHLPIPAYLKRDPSGVRQFERNVLPSLHSPLVRTAWAQRIGYDRTCHGVEDYDFFLRSCMDGARIAYAREPGYRRFADATGVSRELPARRAGVKALLAKHPYSLVRARFGASGHDPAVTTWALVALAFYREDWGAACHFLHEAAETAIDARRVLEADGPCPHPEGWRLGFYAGTLALLTGRIDAARQDLERAHTFARTPESLNNLGVAYAEAGLRTEAQALFREARRLFPGYLDATDNLDATRPSCITTHPLRATPARTEYSESLAS